MTVSDTLLIVTTLLSPLIAVQVQKFIEYARERKNEKRRIFRALMSTRFRTMRVAPEHVQALNMIDLEFHGSRWLPRTKKEKAVLEKWSIYFDHLYEAIPDEQWEKLGPRWTEKGDELFADLLDAIAQALGYSIDRVKLKKGMYYPRAFNIVEARQELIQRGLIDVLLGKTNLKMDVESFPYSEEGELERKIKTEFLSAVEGGALKIRDLGPATNGG